MRRKIELSKKKLIFVFVQFFVQKTGQTQLIFCIKKMKTIEQIRLIINKFGKGYVFTYNDFELGVNKQEAIIKALNRLAKAKKIIKLSKGKYYKPENSPFGNLQPKQSQIVKDLLKNNKKLIGYLTGYSVYHKLGLTTQISNTIQIGTNEIRPSPRLKRERYTISFIKQKNTITKKNIPLLRILDAIRYIKNIPDSSVENSCKHFLFIIKNLSLTDKKKLVDLSLKYPPATKALLGAILEQLQEIELSTLLLKFINPITKYKLGKLEKTLIFAKKWNII